MVALAVFVFHLIDSKRSKRGWWGLLVAVLMEAINSWLGLEMT